MGEITNEVLAERISGLTKLIEQKFEDNKTDHVRIEAQTTKTNGSVATTFKQIRKLQDWRNYTAGAIAVIVFILTVVIIPNWNLLIGK